MAVFLMKSKLDGTQRPPPATGTVFAGVPVSNPVALWIEQLAGFQITGGMRRRQLLPGELRYPWPDGRVRGEDISAVVGRRLSASTRRARTRGSRSSSPARSDPGQGKWGRGGSPRPGLTLLLELPERGLGQHVDCEDRCRR